MRFTIVRYIAITTCIAKSNISAKFFINGIFRMKCLEFASQLKNNFELTKMHIITIKFY